MVLSLTDRRVVLHRRQGEFVVTEDGVEGSLIYAFSALLRDAISPKARLRCRSTSPRGAIIDECSPSSRSHAARVRSRATCRASRHRRGQGRAVARMPAGGGFPAARPPRRGNQALPLRLVASRLIDEAISTAGGVRFEGLDGGQMIAALPGVFCAGEMLDWEAPTGGC